MRLWTLVVTALVVTGFKCTPGTSSGTPRDSTVTVSESVTTPTPLSPTVGRVTIAPATGQAGVQVSADSAGQVGATLGPALAPAAATTGVRFHLFKSGGTWRWRLTVTATGRVLAVSGESYTTRAADSTAARRVAQVASTASIGN